MQLDSLAGADLQHRYDDYWRKVARFCVYTFEGRELVRQGRFAEAYELATGLTEAEALEMCEAKWEWDQTHAEPAATERSKFHGPQRCGYCGGEFAGIDELLRHESFCSFAPRPKVRIENRE